MISWSKHLKRKKYFTFTINPILSLTICHSIMWKKFHLFSWEGVTWSVMRNQYQDRYHLDFTCGRLEILKVSIQSNLCTTATLRFWKNWLFDRGALIKVRFILAVAELYRPVLTGGHYSEVVVKAGFTVQSNNGWVGVLIWQKAWSQNDKSHNNYSWRCLMGSQMIGLIS